MDPIHHPAEMASDWPQILDKLAGRCRLLRRLLLDLRKEDGQPRHQGCHRHLRTLTDRPPNSPLRPLSSRRPQCAHRGGEGGLSPVQGQRMQLAAIKGCWPAATCSRSSASSVTTSRTAATSPRPTWAASMSRARKRTDSEFKVPSLRNVARTAPYFHDGSVQTLEGAVSVMAEIPSGKAAHGERPSPNRPIPGNAQRGVPGRKPMTVTRLAGILAGGGDWCSSGRCSSSTRRRATWSLTPAQWISCGC